MGYLWTEDTSAGLHFWKLVNQLFFAEEFVVESKGSNQGLLENIPDSLYAAELYIENQETIARYCDCY